MVTCLPDMTPWIIKSRYFPCALSQVASTVDSIVRRTLSYRSALVGGFRGPTDGSGTVWSLRGINELPPAPTR
jgi:hypothetical protein